MSAAPTQTAPTKKRLEEKVEKKKIDPHKFSKLLAAHCLDNGIELPPPAFMTDLDSMANGTYPYLIEEMEEDEGTQEVTESDDEDQQEFMAAQDEYYLTASRSGKEARHK